MIKRRKHSMKRGSKDQDYDVGYGKPPRHIDSSQANQAIPTGRRRGSRSFATL